jgi:hypothetical protein
MESAKINDWLQVVGIFAVVASLIYVGLQMKQSQDNASTERSMLRAATNVDLKSAINEHADIWARGNSGEDLDDTDSVIFQNLSVAHVAFYQSSYRAAQRLGLRGVKESNLVVFSSFLQDNPGARRVWNSREDHYARAMRLLYDDEPVADFVIEVRSNLAKLDQDQD